jgi:type I protein arginine methyltransferase
MYSIRGYGVMIQDAERTGSYARALRRTVTRGSVVLDIGTGAGIMAILSCRYGARKVYAVEPASVIRLAREAAESSGYTGSIEFIQDMTTNITLPEKVDVIVSDLHGITPQFENMIPTIMDARERFLKPGGHLIPARETLWAAPVRNPDLYRQMTEPWEGNDYICSIPTGRRTAVNNFTKSRIGSDQLLSEPQCCGVLDYGTICAPNFRAEITQTITQPGTGHGHALWFDSTLAEGVSFSNAPGAGDLIFGQAFFPWTEPVALEEGDTVTLKLQAFLRHDGDYIWRWDTNVLANGRAECGKARFSQSTLFAEALAAGPRAAASYVPALNRDGEIELAVLSLMDGKKTQQEIAEELCRRYPARFSGVPDALTRIAMASQRYS